MKKISLFLTVTLLVLSITMGSYAQEADDKNVDLEYHASCPSAPGGLHVMRLVGRGFLYQENSSGKIQKKLIENGNTFRCKYCGHYLICTGRPQLGWAVANYLEGGSMYLKGMIHGSIFEFRTKRSTTNYTSNKTIPGYRFE
ncbi:MAG: hypothetical protein KZY61_05310 [Clostridiaceae bacterium]|nr:hypothetical protein [Clostridiaceae bacterium]MBW4858608.1 hypothetical protein [Clostridiaceae bacterium]MBW4868067.1 hypothetical protein [Clostridiaceae bacterium]